MHIKSIIKTAILFIAIVNLSACLTTSKVSDVWNDETYERGQIKKVLVIGLLPETYQRRGLEYSIKKKLQSEHVQAVASIEIFPDKEKLTRDTLEVYLKNSDFDAVLLTGFRAITKEMNPNIYENAKPSNVRIYIGFYGHYHSAYDYSYSAFTVKNENVLIEASLFDIKSGKMVWKSISQTSNPENISEILQPVSNSVVNNLVDLDYFY